MTKHLPIVAGALIAVITLMYPGEPRAQSQENVEPSPEVETVTEAKEPTPHLQSPEEALAQDLALIAAARGWTVEQAAADHRAAEVVGRIAEQVASERPDIFVGSVLSPEPGGAPALYIKGSADEFVRALVAGAEIDIKVVDDQPFSSDELEEREMQVARTLEALGFQSAYISSSITDGGQIIAGVTRQPGLPDDQLKILSGLPAELRASVALTVSDAPVSGADDAFGGMQLRDDGANECTSGWSVWKASSGTTGVTGAGHCLGINQIVDPSAGVLWLTFQAQHEGQWGDVEWYTSTQVERAKFYPYETAIKDVHAVEPVSQITVGEYVCLYGRATNGRVCSQVEDESAICIFSGKTHERLVQMNDDVAMPGDSGGGWSNGNTAFGSHSGHCGNPSRDFFSVADLYDEAIGVSVRLSHTLPTGVTLYTGDTLTSSDGRFTAIMQTDGNFVVYRNGVGAIWASSWCGQTAFGPGFRAVMQTDGNFVVYTPSSVAVWATSFPQTQSACISNQQTVFGSSVYMVMQNDGNLVMYRPGYGAVWATNTGGQ